MTTRMPVVFIGHGSPINALEDNSYSRAWAALGRSLPRPKAIVCISAHWEADGAYVTAADFPGTIHEFYGYPKQLQELQYGAPGSAELARRVTRLLSPQDVTLDGQRGFDHGAWTVLAPMYPAADIPVVEISLDTEKSGQWHFNLAKRLRPLRDEGVLIMGSGNLVHNLAAMDRRSSTPPAWATRFNERIKAMLLQKDYEGLCDWPALGADAALSVPTPEHYLPLLYAAAQQVEGDSIRFETDEIISAVSMTSVIIGD